MDSFQHCKFHPMSDIIQMSLAQEHDILIGNVRNHRLDILQTSIGGSMNPHPGIERVLARRPKSAVPSLTTDQEGQHP